MLSTELPETSEKPLPPRFPEAEALGSPDTAGEHLLDEDSPAK